MTNGLSLPYLWDESTFILGALDRIAPGIPRFATSHLGLFCLPLSHKKGAMFIWVNKVDFIKVLKQDACKLYLVQNKFL